MKTIIKKHPLQKIVSITTVFLLALSCSSGSSKEKDDNQEKMDTTVFTVIGDVPYSDGERTQLINMIAAHNAQATSEFAVHLGDIKTGGTDCTESVYQDISSILKGFTIPTFIVLGDNEYNDCSNPTQGFQYWNHYFLHFNENWPFPHKVSYQKERPENFSWIENNVLFIGINIVGSAASDEMEWQTRLNDDANWIDQLLSANKDKVTAAVVFGHANVVNIDPERFKTFTDGFRASASNFGKPILHIHGDGHFWLMNRPWDEQNVLRVQVDAGANPLQVTIDPNLEQPFSFDRNFLK